MEANLGEAEDFNRAVGSPNLDRFAGREPKQSKAAQRCDRKMQAENLAQLINLSTNQILTRTILTSVSTALSIIPLYFLVPALREFTGSILFGIVVGTFSSIYVASALLLYLPSAAGAVAEKYPVGRKSEEAESA